MSELNDLMCDLIFPIFPKESHISLEVVYNGKILSTGYCHDIPSLMNVLGLSKKPNDWQLLTEPSNTSLKAVLLLNGNEQLFLKILRPKMENICADLKVVALLTELLLKHCLRFEKCR